MLFQFFYVFFWRRNLLILNYFIQGYDLFAKSYYIVGFVINFLYI